MGCSRTVTVPPSTSTSTSSSRPTGEARRAQLGPPSGRRRGQGAGLGGSVGQRQRVAGEQQLKRDQGRQQQCRDRGDELDRGLASLATHRTPTSCSRRRSPAAVPAAAAEPAPRPRPPPPSSTRAPCRIDGGNAARRACPAASLPTSAARAPARAATPADHSACPASASWAATRIARRRNGRTPTSSIEAEPASPRRRLGSGPFPDRPRARIHAWRAEANDSVTAQPLQPPLSRCWPRSRSARSRPPRPPAGGARRGFRRRSRTSRRCRRSGARSGPAPRRGSPAAHR